MPEENPADSGSKINKESMPGSPPFSGTEPASGHAAAVCAFEAPKKHSDCRCRLGGACCGRGVLVALSQ